MRIKGQNRKKKLLKRYTVEGLSHKLFTDNLVIYSRAFMNEATLIKQILNDYASVSGKTINYSKSALAFNASTPRDIRTSIARILGIFILNGHDKFLGAPAMFKQSKTKNFEYIKNVILSETSSWKEQLLSKGGKEVLIKSVASAILSTP